MNGKNCEFRPGSHILLAHDIFTHSHTGRVIRKTGFRQQFHMPTLYLIIFNFDSLNFLPAAVDRCCAPSEFCLFVGKLHKQPHSSLLFFLFFHHLFFTHFFCSSSISFTRLQSDSVGLTLDSVLCLYLLFTVFSSFIRSFDPLLLLIFFSFLLFYFRSSMAYTLFHWRIILPNFSPHHAVSHVSVKNQIV